MSDEANSLRSRAAECRRLSGAARDARDRDTLANMASELDAEADKIDAEDAAKPDDA